MSMQFQARGDAMTDYELVQAIEARLRDFEQPELSPDELYRISALAGAALPEWLKPTFPNAVRMFPGVLLDLLYKLRKRGYGQPPIVETWRVIMVDGSEATLLIQQDTQEDRWGWEIGSKKQDPWYQGQVYAIRDALEWIGSDPSPWQPYRVEFVSTTRVSP